MQIADEDNTMFALYCDDSGTHAQSPIAVAACFVAPVVQWEQFAKDWQAANAAEGFGVFHMADFVAHQKQFALPEWQDEQKRNRTLKRLINIALTRRQMGFCAAVEKLAYDDEVPQALREKRKLGNNHYTFAVRMCMAKVLKWRMKYNHKGPIRFVFDRMSTGTGEINAVFEQALEEGDEKALAHGISKSTGWSFEDKAVTLPLQAADILAWETLRHMNKVYLPDVKEPMRKSYQSLTEISDPGFHNRATLRAFVEHIKNRTGGAW
jgi:Protein of unknown function (DUF3800)